ncbi:asparagine synthase [Clostridium sp. YIM B02505]|uniref:Asparagine synthase n=1 Tax=Clostridium yunnanense TaxID=2800325 RepID=A0ABS1EML3_9CLOT|nr:asparagine synthase [Clostridium yunnanense]MBK1810597.1 asparagine synthase [Clostridium yunnanense]
MRIKEGTIPTLIGSVVVAGTAALRANELRKHGMRKKDIVPMAETALLGFGLAHVVLGTIDMVQHHR